MRAILEAKEKDNVDEEGSGKRLYSAYLREKERFTPRIVNDVSRKTLQKIIRTKVVPKSVVYSDSFKSYDGLVLDGFKYTIE